MALANMTQEETNKRNRETCAYIAHNLEMVASGQLVRCDECGEVFDLYNDVDEEWEHGDACPHCGEECYPEQLSIYEWLDEALDITYTMSSDGEMLGACVMVACGGPNIYVNTHECEVQLFWWGDKASYPIHRDACDALDDALREYFEYAKTA